MSAATTLSIQVTFDCVDPHTLVRFWADAFGFTVEDHHELVVRMLELGHAQESDTVEIDGRKAWAIGTGALHPSGTLPRLLFQRVPEPKVVKDRIHLDIHVAADDLAAVTARVLALGGTHLWDGRQGPFSWSTYADPEGNEFCLSAAAAAVAAVSADLR